MDFIPFNNGGSNRNKTSSPHSFKNNNSNSQKKSSDSNMKKSLSFGSPAVGMPAFGSPAVNFGSPAVQNSGHPGLNRYNTTPSPRHLTPQYSPRSHMHNQSPFQWSPKGQSPRHYSPYGGSNNKQPDDHYRYSREGNSFKTPHQFSPNRGRGNGRKSFNRQFQQNSSFDYNAGGSSNIEDFYLPSMVEDPWCNYRPVFLKT